MNNLEAKPALKFKEAVNLGIKRIFELNGRSRRSEFWWFFLVFLVVDWILSIFLSAAPMILSLVISILFGLILVPITIRRLQDGGYSKWWVIIGWLASTVYIIYFYSSGLFEAFSSINPNIKEISRLSMHPVMLISALVCFITGLPTFIFTLLDGKPEPNKYGDSPKYYSDEEFEQ